VDLQRVLIVEDDADIARLLARHARHCGAETQVESDGSRALRVARGNNWDLIVLDWRLPGLDGVRVCERLRSFDYRFPILMLTARVSIEDRIAGLDAGADDYVPKPFSVGEFRARVRSHLRRAAQLRLGTGAVSSENDQRRQISCGDLRLDLAGRRVFRRGSLLALTAREFDLLTFFAANVGRTFSRLQLLEAVWGSGFDGFEHTVNSHINRLRAKIEVEPQNPRVLVTVWGRGYRFDVDARE
jgi:DNA-binding response OmpR family regulator